MILAALALRSRPSTTVDSALAAGAPRSPARHRAGQNVVLGPPALVGACGKKGPGLTKWCRRERDATKKKDNESTVAGYTIPEVRKSLEYVRTRWTERAKGLPPHRPGLRDGHGVHLRPQVHAGPPPPPAPAARGGRQKVRPAYFSSGNFIPKRVCGSAGRTLT